MRTFSPMAGLVLALFSLSANAFCFQEAADRYRIDPLLLKGLAMVESSNRPDAINTGHLNKTRSIDIGFVQINSRWLKREPFKSLGYTEKDLLNPCTNLMAGAWILADNFRVHGAQNWEAVGAYNASCVTLTKAQCRYVRSVYIWKVYNAMQTIRKTQS